MYLDLILTFVNFDQFLSRRYAILIVEDSMRREAEYDQRVEKEMAGTIALKHLQAWFSNQEQNRRDVLGALRKEAVEHFATDREHTLYFKDGSFMHVTFVPNGTEVRIGRRAFQQEVCEFSDDPLN